jgi:hypothetical protein
MARLIIHRPVLPSPGNGRRFRLFLDGYRLDDLGNGGEVRTPIEAGPHTLTVRCWPMTSGALNFSATVDARMDVSAYVDPWSSLQLSLDDRRVEVP